MRSPLVIPSSGKKTLSVRDSSTLMPPALMRSVVPARAGVMGESRLQLRNLVLEQGGGDRRLAGLALQERLGEHFGLLVFDLARQWRLVRVDVDIYDGRAVMRQRLADRATGVAGVLHLDSQRPIGGRQRRVVDERLGIADP